MTTVGSETKVIETSEALVSYRDVGKGDQVLLCLHGGGPGATGWGNFGKNAEDLRDRFRLIIPDHPGFGASRIKKDTGAVYHTLSALSMSELLTAIGVDKAHVLGNSMGGGVALRMAINHSAQVDRLVLMGPWLTGFGLRYFSPPLGTWMERYYPNPSLEKMRNLITAFVYDGDFEGADALAESRYDASLDPDIEAGYLRMSTGQDAPTTESVLEQVQALNNRTLLLWGREDRMCPLDDALMYLAALDNAELVIFQKTGHWVQIERRAEFARYVAAFLDS